MIHRFSRDDGFGLVTALSIAFIVLAVGAMWYSLATHELDEVGADRWRTAALNSAEAGVREAMWMLATNEAGFRDDADAGLATVGITGGICDLQLLESMRNGAPDRQGEYWVQVTPSTADPTTDRRYLIEGWGWAPQHAHRQAVTKYVTLEVELLPLGGFRHALFAAAAISAGNRKEIYGDVYSGEDFTISNWTRLLPNDPPHRGNGNLLVYGDLVVSNGSNVEISGLVAMNGTVTDSSSGSLYLGDVVARQDATIGPASNAPAYFKKTTVGGQLLLGGTLDPSSKVTGPVTENAAGIPTIVDIPLPTFDWDKNDYSPDGMEWDTWADFAAWYASNKGALEGAHYVKTGGGTWDLQNAVFADDFLLVVEDSLTVKGSVSGTTSPDAPVTVAIVENDPADLLTVAQGFTSIDGQVHYLIFSKGQFKASQLTTIYGSVYANEDISNQRLEIHFREPDEKILGGFEFDPSLADRYIPQPLTWREPQPVPVPCTLP